MNKVEPSSDSKFNILWERADWVMLSALAPPEKLCAFATATNASNWFDGKLMLIRYIDRYIKSINFTSTPTVGIPFCEVNKQNKGENNENE